MVQFNFDFNRLQESVFLFRFGLRTQIGFVEPILDHQMTENKSFSCDVHGIIEKYQCVKMVADLDILMIATALDLDSTTGSDIPTALCSTGSSASVLRSSSAVVWQIEVRTESGWRPTARPCPESETL